MAFDGHTIISDHYFASKILVSIIIIKLIEAYNIKIYA